MSITIDAISSSPPNTTWSHTVGTGTNRLLLVFTGTHNSELVTGVTYGGVALTLAKSQDGTWRNVRIYYLVNPTSGAANVVVSGSFGSNGCACGAISLESVLQDSPIVSVAGVNGSSATPSLVITSATNDLIFDVLCQMSSGTSSAFAPGADQTERIDIRAKSSGAALGVTTKAGAASVTTTQTASGMSDNNYAYASVSVKFAPPPITSEDFSVSDVHSVYNSHPIHTENFSVSDSIKGHVIYERSISESFTVSDSNNKQFGKTKTESFTMSDSVSVTKNIGSAAFAHGVVRYAEVPFPTILCSGGFSSYASVSVPFPSVASCGGAYVINSAPFPTISCLGHVSNPANVSGKVPFPTISISGSVVNLCSVIVNVIFPIITSSGHIGGLTSVDSDVPFPSVIAEATVGNRFDSTILKFSEK